jgi:ubiquitin C-terminal hydrolase
VLVSRSSSNQRRENFCAKGARRVNLTQTLTIKSKPKALLVHLKRFTFHMHHGEMISRKSETLVKSENAISLEPFTEMAAKGGDDTYKLIGVAHHIGPSRDSGHYTADALRKEDNGDRREWVNFDAPPRLQLKVFWTTRKAGATT